MTAEISLTFGNQSHPTKIYLLTFLQLQIYGQSLVSLDCG